MTQQVIVPMTTLEKFNRLADFLEKASQLAREIGQGKVATFRPSIPELKRPKFVPKDEEWFWSDEWQTGERQANEDLKAGRYAVFESAGKLIEDLHSHV